MFMSRATAIEMVTALAHSQHGRQYLAQQGIMDKISNMIRGAETDPFSSLYLPGEGIHIRSVQVGAADSCINESLTTDIVTS